MMIVTGVKGIRVPKITKSRVRNGRTIPPSVSAAWAERTRLRKAVVNIWIAIVESECKGDSTVVSRIGEREGGGRRSVVGSVVS